MKTCCIGRLAFCTTLLACSLAMNACDKSESQLATMKQSGDPDDPVYGFDQDDAQMNAAIDNARKSVDEFIAALNDPAQGDFYFSVKKPFETDDGGHEHIWLEQPRFDGTVFHGRVANIPAHVPNLREGDATTVAKDELSDWMIMQPDGKLIGGYTIRVFRDRMDAKERAEFDRETGFKFD